MIVNVKELQEIIKKATLNYAIDGVSISIEKDKVVSKVTNPTKTIISILNMENDVIKDVKGDVTLLFSEPNANVIPYLALIDTEEANLEVDDEKMRLVSGNQKSDIFFCSKNYVVPFNADGPRADVEYFYELNLDGDFLQYYSKIKKIAPRFGKVYFTISKGAVLFETTDKTNKYSNGIAFKIGDLDVKDKTLTFEYGNFSNLMRIIDGRDDFTMKLSYNETQKIGILYCYDVNKTEQYILMSILESK